MKNNQAASPILLFLCLCVAASMSYAQGFEGYYQFPDVHKDKVVFSAEGDLWIVSLSGGMAQRLTTHPETESYPKFSPDGKSIAFSASYEGPTELYTIPTTGGMTKRWTYESDASISTNWTPNGEILYATRAYNKKPDFRLVQINPKTKARTFVPLDQASEGCYDDAGKTLYFVRPAFHRNVTKRYEGGTARQIWKYTQGSKEAVKLTVDHEGGSHHPMWYKGRVYFITDRDGTMNVWSMNSKGKKRKQHTFHDEFDVRYASLSDGIIVYQHGADIWKYNISSGKSQKIEIRLVSDLDQMREKWEENPARYLTSLHPDAKGEKVVATARGRVFVIPSKPGRIVSFAHKENVRYRDAIFSDDGEKVYTLSDESGEFEYVSLPANGYGDEKQISSDGKVLRFGGRTSSDGKYLAYHDLENNMFILDLETGKSKKISTNREGISGYSWSPDNQWIAYVQTAANTMRQIKIYNVLTGKQFDLTTDRANSFDPSWSPDGKFIYFISDRNFSTLVGAPWGPRAPEPFFDVSEKIYHVALKNGTRSPFRADDEVYLTEKEEKKDDKKEDKDKKASKDSLVVDIDIKNIQRRLLEVPVKPGNYYNLSVNDKAIYVMSHGVGRGSSSQLNVIKITKEKPKVTTMIPDVGSYELTSDGKKILVRKGSNAYMVGAGTGKIGNLNDSKIDFGGWKFSINPKEDWRQIFTDAWRMERDYFYDKNMHGVDWQRMHDKYEPLLDRVTTRQELSDLIGRFVGELSALHTSVGGGDTRSDKANISVANLGGIFSRNEGLGGYKIDYIYKADPDYPDEKSPLDDAYLDIKEGDVITAINGRSTLDVVDINELLRNQAGRQVRLSLKRDTAQRDVVVKPIRSSYNLRYRDWEYGNRLKVDQSSNNDIGYLHLRAMGSNDVNQFFREFYPIYNRRGLIIDVRYNFGGNIDSYILSRLLRKAWMYWKSRSGEPYWNMQYAFRGHIVVLVNENTYSDGEAFADGFKRLGLGTAIGTRTWGGEIWLHSGNRLTDGGLARAPMMGVYADGKWLIEGRGFEPDIEIDNLPHATYKGKDAQLEKAIQFLKQKIKEDPRDVPRPPAYPDKSFKNNRQ